MKVKAGALQFVLFIGVVIALLLLAFMTLSYTHSFFGKKTHRLIDTIKWANIGMDYAKQNPSKLNDTITVPLDNSNGIDVKYIQSYWGIFEKYSVVSSFENNKITKVALIGGENASMPAVYLQDLNRPLIIAGNSKIVGDAFLPKQGIRPGNIAGQSYYKNRMIYGNEKQSTATLPDLDRNLRNHLDGLVASSSLKYVEKSISVSQGDLIRNSFKNSCITVVGERIDLSGVSLIGNIKVLANNQIIIDASTKLTDVVLQAPRIIIRNGFKGRFQAIANSMIDVGTNCTLEYPSALIVNNRNKSEAYSNLQGTPNISIGNGSIVDGIVMFLGEEKEQTFFPQIKISEGVNIAGEIYCEQNLELEGNVIGSVTTRNFLALENGSIYQNHLFNGTINSNDLPKKYSGILYGNMEYKNIGQWLY